jgi:pimeloyl-ACP methyl ester carboxylesterase
VEALARTESIHLANEGANQYSQNLDAFENSSPEAMMNYYGANYPRVPYDSGAFLELNQIERAVLQFHGLDGNSLLPNALNSTWEELAKDWTLMPIPGDGHWLHIEKPKLVTDMMKAWLNIQRQQ